MHHWKNFILLAFAGVVIASCGPKKEEGAQQEELSSATSSQPTQSDEGTLTPHQKEELKIEEENVMDTFPG